MVIFYIFVAIMVIIAWIRIRNATGEVPPEDIAPFDEESTLKRTKPRRKKTAAIDFWSFPSEGGGSEASSFDGGSSDGGDGSSTGF